MRKNSQHIADPQNIESGWLRALDFSGALYAQLFDAEPKCTRMKSEDGGGASFAIDLPAGILKDLEDMLPLHPFKLLGGLFLRFGRLAFEPVH